jgi:hypothetical protein
MQQPRRRWFSQEWKDSKQSGKSWQYIKKRKLWEEYKTGNFSSTGQYEMELMFGGGEHI